MTAGQNTRRLSTVSLAPGPLAALLAATLLGGAIVGAGVALQLGSTDPRSATIGAAQPAAAFDAAKFRAEEHGAFAPQAEFDATKFRAEEHGAFAPQAEFDATKFRAEEHGALAPQSGSDAVSSERRDRLGGP